MMRTGQKHINHCTEDLNVGQIQLPAVGKKAANGERALGKPLPHRDYRGKGRVLSFLKEKLHLKRGDGRGKRSVRNLATCLPKQLL